MPIFPMSKTIRKYLLVTNLNTFLAFVMAAASTFQPIKVRTLLEMMLAI